VSALFQRALARIPGGVDSPVRSFASVGGEPFFVAEASGACLVDTDGRRYLDYVQSWGASILGHAHPAVVEAVQAAAAGGTSYGAPTAREVELAEAISERVPSAEKVRLVSSGTEAGMTAVRLARGATGRTRILKFAGCYHGHADPLLVAAGSGVATFGLPGSAGVTAGTVADTVVVPYNDDHALDVVFAELGADLAAVLVEPVAANMGLVAPIPGFVEGLRRRCTAAGALLVFDEVITGFRVARGGAQGLTGVAPDLSMFGKVIGGGLPLAAIAGRADVMDELAPLGPVYQAGTLSGNPVATAAGLAVLAQLDDEAYAALERSASRYAEGLRAALAGAVPAAQVVHVGTLTGVFFADAPVTDFAAAQLADHTEYARVFHALLDAGVFWPPSGYEAMFVSLAHTDDDLDRTCEAVASAVRRAV
jgi:glutamate-1-semialdehyde 2,1-aminomutase